MEKGEAKDGQVKKTLKMFAKPKENLFKDWDLQNKYTPDKLIGQGSYGTVCRAKSVATGELVAIKRIHNIFNDGVDCKRILREIAILRRLNHECIVKVKEILMPPNPDTFDVIYVVMEYAQGDLKKIMKSGMNLEIVHIKNILYNLICAIKFMSDCKVIHRDIKSANILINENCSVRLCDFSLARSLTNVKINSEKILFEKILAQDAQNVDGPDVGVLNRGASSSTSVNSTMSGAFSPALVLGGTCTPEDKQFVSKMLIETKKERKNIRRELSDHVVTRFYRAPEIILLEKDYGPAVDMWSVGCVFAELLGTMKESAPTFLDRKPLFPGQSCFPLSPSNKAD